MTSYGITCPPHELIHIMIRKCGYALYNPHCGPVVISVSMQSIMSAMFGLYHTGAAKTVLQSLCTRLWCSLVAVAITPGALSLHWRHNERDGVSNQQRIDCLFSRLFRLRSKKTSKLRVTGLCAGNSPVNGEFPARRASNAENVSIWWRHNAQRCSDRGRASIVVTVDLRTLWLRKNKYI